MVPTPVVAAVLAPLVLWRVYNRIKRLTVRQKSQLWRHRISLFVFPPLLLLMVFAAIGHPLALAAMAAGVAAGAALGLLGLRKTRFEQVGDEFFYTPNAHIGVAVSLLFLGRMAWRACDLYVHGAPREEFGSSPLTLLVFGVLAGFYLAYANGLLRWRKRAAANN